MKKQGFEWTNIKVNSLTFEVFLNKYANGLIQVSAKQKLGFLRYKQVQSVLVIVLAW